jgi:hypothetical protein
VGQFAEKTQSFQHLFFAVVGPGGAARHSNFNGLRLQTCVPERIERKGIFGAATNLKTGIPFARNSARRHIAPSERPETGAALCTNAVTNVGTPAAQKIGRKIDRHSSRGRPCQLGGAYSGAHALVRDKEVAGLNLVTPTSFSLFDRICYDPLGRNPKAALGQLSRKKNPLPLKKCVRVIRRARFAATRIERTVARVVRNRGFDISLEGLRAFGGFSTFSDKPDSFRAFDNKQLIDPVRITLPHATLSDEGCAPTGAS